MKGKKGLSAAAISIVVIILLVVGVGSGSKSNYVAEKKTEHAYETYEQTQTISLDETTTQQHTAANEAENYYEPEQNYDYVPEDSGGSGGVTVPDAVWEGDNLVWIPVNGGTKYHTNAGCSNMKDPIQVPLEQAVANGFEPCKRCH